MPNATYALIKAIPAQEEAGAAKDVEIDHLRDENERLKAELASR